MANSKQPSKFPGNADLLIGGVPASGNATSAPSRGLSGMNLPIGEQSSAPVWHREYWDRYIRDQAHLIQVIEYIHLHPVKAGLVNKSESWPWSSAFGNANLPIGA